MKSHDSRQGRFPRGPLSHIAHAAGFVLLLLAAARPVGATIGRVVPSPSDPTACDPVTLTVTGELSSPCYEIVGAKIEGPAEIPCMRIFPCPFAYLVEITVREPAPGTPCPAVIEPYTRAFELGKLAAGEYHVRAMERVIPYTADSSGITVDSSFAFATFTSYPDTACTPGFGCYILSIGPDVIPPDAEVIPGPFCTATTAPGDTAWVDLALLNSIPVGGLQATVALPRTRSGISPEPFIHPVAVEVAPRASGFQVAWTSTGPDLKFVLYSAAGTAIPAGRGPVLRIQYATAPETPPATYPIVTSDAIVADTTGESIEPCPTFAPIEPGRLCVLGPGCDVNGDGSSNILDIIRLVRCVLAAPGDATGCPDTDAARADCNADQVLDVRDIICCVRKILSASCTLCEEPVPVPPATGATEIGFGGPVRWINDVEGIVLVDIKPGSDLAGTQFGVESAGSAARVRGIKLIEGDGAATLEWAADESGGARAAIFSMTAGQALTAPLRVEVAVERTIVAGSGALALSGVLSGTNAGAAAPTKIVNASVEVPQTAVRAPALLPARPNPFRSSTEFGFVLSSDLRATLRIYDVAGRLVRTVLDGPLPAGIHRLTWDGTDSGGRAAGTGIYFAKWSAGTAGGSERLLLLK